MTYICKECTNVVEDYEIKREKGEWLDGYYMGDDYVCPHCGSEEFQEAVQCPICGEYVAKEESYDGFCEDCVDKAATPENLIEWCDLEDETEFLEVNSAVASMCRELKIDINDLLKAAVNESVYKDRVLKACQESVKQEFDTEYFMKWWKNRG